MKGLIQDNEYKLIVYKVSRPVETTNYLTLPSIHGPGTENEVQRIDGVQYTKDFVVVQVNIKYSCSRKNYFREIFMIVFSILKNYIFGSCKKISFLT